MEHDLLAFAITVVAAALLSLGAGLVALLLAISEAEEAAHKLEQQLERLVPGRGREALR